MSTHVSPMQFTVLVICLLFFSGSWNHCFAEAAFSSHHQSPTENTANSQVEILERNKPVRRELTGDTVHRHPLLLTVGQYVHIKLTPAQVPAEMRLLSPTGEQITNAVTPDRKLAWVVEAEGEYRVEVHSLKKDISVTYHITLVELRPATPLDRSRMVAQNLFVEAEQLTQSGKGSDLRQARTKYEESLPHWRAAQDTVWEGITLTNLGMICSLFEEHQQALAFFQQSLPLSKASGELREVAQIYDSIGRVHCQLGEYQKALDFYDQGLIYVRSVGDRQIEAMTLTRIGSIYRDWAENQKALEFYQQALQAFQTLGDRDSEAAVRNNIAEIYSHSGEYQKALDQYQQALSWLRLKSNPRGEARVLQNIGLIYLALGQLKKALSFYEPSLQLYRLAEDRRGEARSLGFIGFIQLQFGEHQSARDYFQQALHINQSLGNHRDEASTLNSLGYLYGRLGEFQKALDSFEQALNISQTFKYRDLEAVQLANIGQVYLKTSEFHKALDCFRKALVLSQAHKDTSWHARVLFSIATVEFIQGQLEQARVDIEQVLSLAETLRTNVVSEELRTSFFSKHQDYFSLYIAILMRMHYQDPTKKYDFEALQVSEQARARSLLDLLKDAQADIRNGIDPDTLKREQDVQQRLNDKTQRQIQLLNGKHTRAQVAAFTKEIEQLTTAYQEIKARIRQNSPQYAELTQPRSSTVSDIQAQALDQDTILLEYALGEQTSYLWCLTSTGLTSYELPKGAEIEAAAQRVYQLLRVPNPSPRTNAQYWQEAAKLSQMILRPVSDQLGTKRLLIVSEGMLQYIPFAALPAPIANKIKNRKSKIENRPIPLVERNEIVMLPSASIFMAQRQALAGRSLSPKHLAVIADPVFEPDDERIGQSTPIEVDRSEILRDTKLRKSKSRTRGFSLTVNSAPNKNEMIDKNLYIPRLPGTRREAANILSLVPANDRFQAFDFAANREQVLSGSLSQYQIIHLATHGFLNTEHPELSGVMLSLVNKQGESQPGLLLALDLFNLKLPAELVVLSACQTGLGKNVRGEGVLGLTRGLMYAGAKRIIVSFWSVSDQATSALMVKMYQKILKEKQSPAAALRAAQIDMWKYTKWKAPYYWAPFVIQGEYR